MGEGIDAPSLLEDGTLRMTVDEFRQYIGRAFDDGVTSACQVIEAVVARTREQLIGRADNGTGVTP